jgi:hypothetical protein
VSETLIGLVIVAVVGPLLTTFLLGRQRKFEAEQTALLKAQERAADWARQDEVAARVEQVAKAASEAQVTTTATLKDIHTLVNSDMTAARQAELTTTRLLAAALRRLAAVRPQDVDLAEAIAAADARAMELEQILADRLVAQRKVEADDTKAKATEVVT